MSWKKIGGIDRTSHHQSVSIPQFTSSADMLLNEINANNINATSTLIIGDSTITDVNSLALDKLIIYGNFKQYGDKLQIVSQEKLPTTLKNSIINTTLTNTTLEKVNRSALQHDSNDTLSINKHNNAVTMDGTQYDSFYTGGVKIYSGSTASDKIELIGVTDINGTNINIISGNNKFELTNDKIELLGATQQIYGNNIDISGNNIDISGNDIKIYNEGNSKIPYVEITNGKFRLNYSTTETYTPGEGDPSEADAIIVNGDMKIVGTLYASTTDGSTQYIASTQDAIYSNVNFFSHDSTGNTARRLKIGEFATGTTTSNDTYLTVDSYSEFYKYVYFRNDRTHDNKTSGIFSDTNNFYLYSGASGNSTHKLHLYSNNLYFSTISTAIANAPSAANTHMLINSSGNIGMGASVTTPSKLVSIGYNNSGFSKGSNNDLVFSSYGNNTFTTDSGGYFISEKGIGINITNAVSRINETNVASPSIPVAFSSFGQMQLLDKNKIVYENGSGSLRTAPTGARIYGLGNGTGANLRGGINIDLVKPSVAAIGDTSVTRYDGIPITCFKLTQEPTYTKLLLGETTQDVRLLIPSQSVTDGSGKDFYIDAGEKNGSGTNGIVKIGSDTTSSVEIKNLKTIGNLVFEGSTENSLETTLTITEPTQDNTIVLPDAGGTVCVSASGSGLTLDANGNMTLNNSSMSTIGTSGSLLTAAGHFKVDGNFTVDGLTTTVNSTTITVDDPIFTLGGDSVPTSDDDKDRGIEFRWHTGTAAKLGFFGFDDSTGKFTFIPDATNTSEVFSGTAGTIVANIEGNIEGTVGASNSTTGKFTSIEGTSLSLTDGNITNVGSISCDSITGDDVLIGLNLQFNGNTGLNKITLSDNLANALDITEGSNSYMKFVTTNSSEKIEFNKDVTFGANAGNQVLDILSHDLVDGGLKLAGTLVTASATELNLLDTATANTVVNSKAVIYSTNGNVAATTMSTTGTLTVGDNIVLSSDSAVLSFGVDSDTTLTHTDGTGLTLNAANKLCFRDSAIHISSDANGYMNVQADTGVNINIGGTDKLAITSSTATFGTNIVIPDAGTIGSVSDTNAISISSAGVVNISSTTASSSSTNGALTVAGGVGIAADLSVGGDLFIYDANNNGNPVLSLGSTTTNALSITAAYNSGSQTLDNIMFATKTTSASINDGQIIFNIDEAATPQFTINDGGIKVGATTLNATELSNIKSGNSAGGGNSVTGTIPVASGGTNITSYTTGDILYASAATTISTLGVSGNTSKALTVNNGGTLGYSTITNAMLANDAVDKDKIHGNVAGSGLTQHTDGSIKIDDLGVATGMFANDAVTYAKIQNITTANRVLGSTAAGGNVAETQVTTNMLANDAVTYAKMQNATSNTVIVRDANTSGVLSAKTVVDKEILIGTGTGFTAAALSGDVTMTNAGAVTIGNSKITNIMLNGSIADGKISSATTWNAKQAALTFGKASGNTLKSEQAIVTNDVLLMGTNNVIGKTYSELKTLLSLDNVSNTTLGTWAGSSNINTLGTIGTGVWNGTAIADGKISSAATWNNKQAALTFGKASGNALQSEEVLASNNVLLMGNNHVKGRTYTEFKGDLTLGNVEDTALSTWAGSSNINTLGTIGTGVWNGTAIADGYLSTISTANKVSGNAVQLQNNKGLENSSGLGIKIQSNKGLSVGANGLATVIEANKGIVVGASGLSIDLNATNITVNGKMAMASLAALNTNIVPVTDGSGVITSSSVTATELATIGGVTAGTATASKALVLDSNKDVTGLRHLTINGTFSDGNYTFDTNGNVTGLGTVGCGAITSSGNLAVIGTITGDTSLTLDSTTITTAEIGVLDGVTAGTATASKALVLDSNKDVTGLRNLTVSDDSVMTFGTTGPVTLTHDTSNILRLGSEDYLAFGVNGINITNTAGGNMRINSSGAMTLTATTGLYLDAKNGAITLKDDNATFGQFANNSNNLVIKSGAITAATFSGADVTFAGDVGIAADLSVGGDLSIYDATNDGNPVLSLGSSAAEALSITATYNSGAQTLNEVTFATATTNGNANKGRMVFNIDGNDKFIIDDGGFILYADNSSNNTTINQVQLDNMKNGKAADGTDYIEAGNKSVTTADLHDDILLPRIINVSAGVSAGTIVSGAMVVPAGSLITKITAVVTTQLNHDNDPVTIIAGPSANSNTLVNSANIIPSGIATIVGKGSSTDPVLHASLQVTTPQSPMVIVAGQAYRSTSTNVHITVEATNLTTGNVVFIVEYIKLDI